MSAEGKHQMKFIFKSSYEREDPYFQLWQRENRAVVSLPVRKLRNCMVLLWVVTTITAFSNVGSVNVLFAFMGMWLSGFALVVLQLECAFHAQWKVMERARRGE